MGEITVILLLALIFLGPKKLPELASGLGKLIREIRKTTADVKNEIQLDEAIRKPFEELRDAVTLHPEELKRRDKLRKELADIQRQAEAAVAAAEENMSQSPPEAPRDEAAGALAEASETASTVGVETSASGIPDAPWSPSGPIEHPSHTTQTLTQTRPSLVVPAPSIPGAAPAGTVARTPSGPVSGPVTGQVPPAPPLAAVLAKGSGPVMTKERHEAQPPEGSDFLRSLRAVPEANRPEASRVEGKPPEGLKLGEAKRSRARTGNSNSPGPAAESAADRGNITQALSEADLAAITVGPPPPPLPPVARNLPPPPLPSNAPAPAPPRLPGATPPKNPNQ